MTCLPDLVWAIKLLVLILKPCPVFDATTTYPSKNGKQDIIFASVFKSMVREIGSPNPLPDGNLYTAGQLSFTDSCAPRYPDFVPKVGGAKKKSMLNKVRKATKKTVNKMKKGSKKIMGKMQGLLKKTKHKGNLTVTIGKDGKKYFFKKGKRVKNPTHAHVHKKHH